MTGVQTCALPISMGLSKEAAQLADIARHMVMAEKAASCSPAFLSAVGLKVKPLGFWHKSAIDGSYPWSACAECGVVVPLEDWLASKGQEKVAGEVKKYLPGIFSRIIGDVSTIEKLAADRSADPSRVVSTEKQRYETVKAASAYSVSPSSFEAAVRSSVVLNVPAPAQVSGFDKSAENSDKYHELARAYAVHQLQWVKSAAKTSEQLSHYCRVITAYNKLA